MTGPGTLWHLWRVRHGFTVHSPFAYRFITGVLRERTPYYHFRREVTDPAEQRLYRVAAYLNPQTVCCPEGRELQVLRLALPHVAVTADPAQADLTVTPGGELPEGCRALYAVRPDRTEWRRLLVRPDRGMTFSGRDYGIAIRRPGLPDQDFRL